MMTGQTVSGGEQRVCTITIINDINKNLFNRKTSKEARRLRGREPNSIITPRHRSEVVTSGR